MPTLPSNFGSKIMFLSGSVTDLPGAWNAPRGNKGSEGSLKTCFKAVISFFVIYIEMAYRPY